MTHKHENRRAAGHGRPLKSEAAKDLRAARRAVKIARRATRTGR